MRKKKRFLYRIFFETNCSEIKSIQLIIEEWNNFKHIFPYTKEKFEEITKYLNVSRCNFNHSNGHLLTEEAQILTKEYINDLLNIVSEKVKL